MRILVTGLPRSGTSATAHLLSRVTGLSLLDDPESAMAIGAVSTSDEWLRDLLLTLDSDEVVKAPRLTEVILDLLRLKSDFTTVHLVRDPRDVYCSVMEKVRSGRHTTMIENDRFSPPSQELWDGVGASAAFYHERQIRAHELHPTRNVLLRYEHFVEARAAEIVSLATRLGLGPRHELRDVDITRQWGPVDAKVENVIVGPGRWRSELSPRVAARIMSIAGRAYYDAAAYCVCSRCIAGDATHASVDAR